jgi:type VI protein secretion system component VasF
MGLLDKAKEAAKTVGEKAQEGIKAGQEKIDETKTKRHIADLKEELGGIVYAQRTGATPADAESEIARIVAEITEAEAQLAQK